MLGSDILLAKGMSAGVSGGICGFGNFFPKQMTKVYNLSTEGKFEDADKLVKALVGVFDSNFKLKNTSVDVIGRLKSSATHIIPTKLGNMRLPSPNLKLTELDCATMIAAHTKFQELTSSML